MEWFTVNFPPHAPPKEKPKMERPDNKGFIGLRKNIIGEGPHSNLPFFQNTLDYYPYMCIHVYTYAYKTKKIILLRKERYVSGV